MENPENSWKILADVEEHTRQLLRPKMAAFEDAIRIHYSLGAVSGFLGGKRMSERHVNVAGMFLKRALTDLRGLWILLCTGYTSQAAAVACSLFENAMAATILASDSTNLESVLTSNGDLPNVKAMVSKTVKWQQQLVQQGGHPFDETEVERQSKSIYLHYTWLCKIKHPTLMSVHHDAMSASKSGETFLVLAAPDVRLEDFPVKRTIFILATNRLSDALIAFMHSLECDKSTKVYAEFIKLMGLATASMQRAIDETAADAAKYPLPFDVGHTKSGREWIKFNAELPARRQRSGARQKPDSRSPTSR